MQSIYSFSKILLTPEVWIFIALGIGCLTSWITQCPRSTRFILCLLAVLYFGLTTRPLTQGLVQPLEGYYRPPATTVVPHDAIVLLVNNPSSSLPFIEQPSIVVTPSAGLLICGLIYVRAGNTSKVVLGHGASGISTRHSTGSAVLEEWAVFLGYPREAIILNDQGIATHERARAIKQLLGSNANILLIDWAMHLPRSAAVFRKAGFNVTPIPCAYYNLSIKPWSLFDFVPGARNLEASSEAVYEYFGLLTYWLRGLI